MTYCHRGTKKSPDGGHGGRGGDVVVRASSDVQSLRFSQSHFFAGDGGKGRKQNRMGHIGRTVEVRVPLGTVVTAARNSRRADAEEELALAESILEDRFAAADAAGAAGGDGEALLTEAAVARAVAQAQAEAQAHVAAMKRSPEKVLADLDSDGKSVAVAMGGVGGRGNIAQKSLSFKWYNQDKYKNRLAGRLGDDTVIRLTLKSIADVGLVGFPNAGKSTMLGMLSRARPEVADYPFTTLHPNIGMIEYSDAQKITMADIPGLIEGAHQNKGLGHSFLRHVERTGTLAYVIDCTDFGLNRDPVTGRAEEYAAGEQGEDASVSPSEHRANRIALAFAKLVTELELYMGGISSRPCVLVLNKMDMLGEDAVDADQVLQAIVSYNQRCAELQEEEEFGGKGKEEELELELELEREGADLRPELGAEVESGLGLGLGPPQQGLYHEDDEVDSKDASQYRQLFLLPLPNAIHRISAKHGGGLPLLARDLRLLVQGDAKLISQYK